MCSRNNNWYWKERKKVLETFYVKWNFVINVNCNGNENICEAIITITFPWKQTILKQYDMNKFNLTQFKCRIQNLINLLVNRKKLNVLFLLLLFKISQINHATTLVWFFFMMCTGTFSYGHLILVSIFHQLTSEKNQVYTGNLTHCRQTLQLIKFYFIKNMKGSGRNWLAQFEFPFLSILWCFSYHVVKFTVSLISLSSVHSFVCFPNNHNHKLLPTNARSI